MHPRTTVASVFSALAFSLASCAPGDVTGSESISFLISGTVGPTTGYPPHTVNVELRFEGTAQGPVSLRLSCGLPQELNPEVVTNENPYRTQCVYTDTRGGMYAILVIATRQGKTATATFPRITVKYVPSPGFLALEDRPDEVSGSQVHAVYIAPRDKQSREAFYLTVDALMARSFSAGQKWFGKEAGLYMRADTHQGFLDITFVRSQYTDAEIAARGGRAGDLLVNDMVKARLNDTTKTYLVYVDATNPETCSSSNVGGGVDMAIIFLQGTHENTPCISIPFLPSNPDLPRLWQYWELRELLRALGYVDPAAPHYDPISGDVTDSRNDLMRTSFDMPAVVDFGNDDYCGDKVPQGVRNCKNDPIMVKVP